MQLTLIHPVSLSSSYSALASMLWKTVLVSRLSFVASSSTLNKSYGAVLDLLFFPCFFFGSLIPHSHNLFEAVGHRYLYLILCGEVECPHFKVLVDLTFVDLHFPAAVFKDTFVFLQPSNGLIYHLLQYL
jgi:hypothetical protein